MANTFKNYSSAAVGTDATVIYTADSGVSATVIGMTIANLLNQTITANVIVNAGGFDFHMVKNVEIDPGNSLITIGGDQKLVLEGNDSIKVSTNQASSVDVILSLLEIT